MNTDRILRNKSMCSKVFRSLKNVKKTSLVWVFSFVLCCATIIFLKSYMDHRAMTAVEQKVEKTSCLGNKTIFCGTYALQSELFKVHSMLYNKTDRSGECKVRDPKCVIIGVAKGGTRELVDFASLHPNIISKPGLSSQELFSQDKRIRIKAATGKDQSQPIPCSYADQIVISKADNFLSLPHMPKVLHEFNPDLKMVLMVREPVERLISHYSFDYLQKLHHTQYFTYRPETIPDIDDVFVDASDGSIKYNGWLKLSMYDVGLERYLKLFPKEQLLIIESNELKKNPVKVLQQLENFLNLQPVVKDNHFEFIKDKGFYCFKNGNVYCYGSDRGRTVLKEIRAETKDTLKTFFKPHNLKFFQLIGKQFDW